MFAIMVVMANIKLVPCPACGITVSPQAVSCPRCGQPLGNRAFGANGQASMPAVNDSGRGPQSAIPPALRGFNWGAFLLAPLWAVFNNSWLGLAAVIPGIGFIVQIVLGVKGNEWAWQNRRWDSMEHFFTTQRNWALWGAILWVVSFALGLILYLGVVLKSQPNW